MMSIVEQYAGKRKRDPEMPAMPRVVSTPHPHDKHAEALSFVGALTEDNSFLRADNTRLQQDLSLAMLRIKDLEREAAARSYDLEAYRRYSVEVKTHLQHIVDAATRANEAALEAGESVPSSDAAIKIAVDAVDQQINGLTEPKETPT